jgi:serine/threonine protein kinase
MTNSKFDKSIIVDSEAEFFPRVLLNEGLYYQVFRVQVNRTFYIYKQTKLANPPVNITDSLRREFDIGHQLNHASIPQYYAFFEENGCPTIVKEFIPGMSLGDFIRSKSFGVDFKVSNFCIAMIEAIQHLHSKGITHGDVSSSNILVHEFLQSPFLIDFNLASSTVQLPIGGGTAGFFDESSSSNDFYERRNADIYGLLKCLELFQPHLSQSLRERLSKIIASWENENSRVSIDELRSIFETKKPRLSRSYRGLVYAAALCCALSVAYVLQKQFAYDVPQDNQRNFNQSSSPAPIQKPVQTKKETETNKKVVLENTDSLKAVSMGREFLDCLMVAKAQHRISTEEEYVAFRYEAIVNANKRWKQYLDEHQIQGQNKKKWIDWYQYGYWLAFQKSESDRKVSAFDE